MFSAEEKEMIIIEIKKSDKCMGKHSLFVSFPYNPTTIERIKKFPIRFWHSNEKCWELPCDKLNELKAVLGDNVAVVDEREKNLEVPTVENFEFKTKPFNHQLQGFAYGMSNDKWLLGDEQGLGKALALDTKVYTPTGYKLMRDIEVGDLVMGEDGKPTTVTHTYYHDNVEMYRITFTDGTTIDCCEDHLWKVSRIDRNRDAWIVDTKFFVEPNQRGAKKNLQRANGSFIYRVNNCEPVQFKRRKPLLNPYVVGVIISCGWVVDKTVAFRCNDPRVAEKVSTRLPLYCHLKTPEENGLSYYTIEGETTDILDNPAFVKLYDLGLTSRTQSMMFIPERCIYTSIDDRFELLQGMFDCDGRIMAPNTGKTVYFRTLSKQLIEDVKEIIESLGGDVGDVRYNENTRKYSRCIRIPNPRRLFSFKERKEQCKTTTFQVHKFKRCRQRGIVSVDKIKNAPAKCITVDNKDSMYLIDHFIPTHNTKQVIDIATAKKKQKGFDHCMIICGVNGLKYNWKNEIGVHSDEKGYILGQREKKNKIVIGGSAEKLEDLKNFKDIKEYFIITNVETFRNKKIVELTKKLCDDGVIGLIAIDEIHTVKNANSQQGKGILKLQPECRIAMTGTPLMNTPIDLFVILKWLGFEDKPLYKFKNHYCVLGGYGGYEVVGYKNMSELSSQLNKVMLRRLKKDVIDLPDKLYINEYVDMTPKQAQIYKEVEMHIKANIDQIKMVNNPLTELIRLRQATGYTGILSSTIKESAKLERMKEIVKETVDNGKKVVIFSNWTQMIDPILESVQEYNPSVITGQVDANERQRMVDKFQNDSNCKVIVGTIGAMGTGLTLTAGTVEIFMDEPWTMASKQQAEDRCHRVGTKENVTIYTIMCKNTIDERIHDIVENKGQIADILVDKNIEDKPKEILDFLLS